MISGNSKTILLVEDEALIALNEKMILEGNGYQVLTAKSGELAVEAFLGTPEIDLVLMDINLGRGIDGTEAAGRILAERDVPLIFLSSHTEPEIVEKTEAISSYGYIVKNSGETVLLASIRMAFRLFESRKLAGNTFDYSINGLCLHRMVRSDTGIVEDFEYLKVNRAFEAQTGLQSGDVIGRTVRELYKEEKASEIVALYDELLRFDTPGRRELHFPPFNGWFEVSVFPTIGDEFAVVIENISERKLAEQRIKESELHFRTLADSGRALVWTSGLDGGCFYFNEPWLAFTGRSLAEERGLGWLKGVHPEDRDRVSETYYSAFRQEEPFSMVYRLRHHSGDYRWVQDDGTSRYDTDGNFLGYIGHCLDISETVEATREREEYRERIESIFRAAPVGIGMVRERVFADTNPRLCEMTGYSEEELIGRSARLLYPTQEEYDFVGREKYRQIRENGTGAVETRWLKKCGEIIDVYLASTPVDPDDLRKGVTFTSLDITDRKQMERALRGSDERFRLLFDDAPVGYQSLDEEGNFLEVNRTWLETLGYSKSEVIGRWFGDFLAPEYVDGFKERFPLFKKRGTIHSEFRLRHRNGEERSISFEGRVGKNLDGSFRQTHCIIKDESEAIAAEVERRKVEELQETLLDNISDVIVIIDSEGINRYKSPNIEKLFGWRPEDLVGGSAWDLLHPEDLPGAQQFFGELLASPGDTAVLECRYRKKDGAYRWIEFAGTNLLSNPAIGGILGTYHDISERRETAAALERSLEELNKSQTFAHIGSWVWHIAENRVEWSEEMYRIFGIDKEEFTGNLATVLDHCIHPEDRREVEESNRSVMTSGVPIPVEYRILRGPGDVRTLWAEAGELERDARGNPVLLRGIVQDITEKKATEESLRIRQRAVDASIDAIAIADLDGALNYVNPAFLAMWGYEDETDVLRMDAKRFWEFGDDAEQVEVALTEHGRWQGVLNGKRKDGTLFPIQLSSSLILTDKGVPFCLMGVFRDITEITETQRRLKAILRETHHRIKNNFSVVESLLAVQTRLAEHPETVSAMQNVRSRLTSIRTLYEILLRTESQEEIPAEHYLHDLAGSLVSASGCDRRISLSIDLEPLSLSASTAFPVGAIVAELITNSLKYAFEEDQLGIVALQLSVDGDRAVLEISDDGRGMDGCPESDFTESFGLSLVQLMAEQIDGTVDLQSAPGQGVRTRISFPV